MADLIDREVAIDAIANTIVRGESIGMWIAEDTLYDVPSVDAVEVVRCKDCKYFDSGIDEDGKLFFKCLGWVYGGTSEDDFCSHGEQKDG